MTVTISRLTAKHSPRFPNTECSSLENNLSGVCYTMKECARRNGRASGQCAAGFGVCCLCEYLLKTVKVYGIDTSILAVVVGCGGSSGENITYFSSEESGTLIEPSSMAEACPTTICKMDDGICQLRLDFLTFSMIGYVICYILHASKSNRDLQVHQRPRSWQVSPSTAN